MPSVATIYNPPSRKEVISIAYGKKNHKIVQVDSFLDFFSFVTMKLDGFRLL